jgi:hypothetical protein
MSRFHWVILGNLLNRRRGRRRPEPPTWPKPPRRRGGVALPEPVEPNPNRPRQGGAAVEMEFDD